MALLALAAIALVMASVETSDVTGLAAVTDNVQAWECARTIAGWKPLPEQPRRSGCILAKSGNLI
jgi:hypothetical protein